jgi:hypothetical protein
MKSLPERLNNRLEQQDSDSWPDETRADNFLVPRPHADPEIDEIVVLARRLQATPQLQVDPAFADQLERRVLRHHLERQKQHTTRGWAFLRFFRVHTALATISTLCLVVLLFSTGVLALAAQANNPTNPLYSLRQWEQHMRYSLAGSPTDQAALDLQFAQERLNALSYLADQAHTDAYLQALANLNQQFTTTASAINALPAGAQQAPLASKLNSLERNARQKLRGFLSHLNLTESVATTTELARLGDTVPQLTSATLVLPAHPNTTATISLSGSDIQPGAQLLVNGKDLEVTGTVLHGQFVFIVDWNGNQHPWSLGILNPDGTSAQTTSITITNANKNSNGTDNKNGNGNNSNGNNNGHGNGNGKPEAMPTPHH